MLETRRNRLLLKILAITLCSLGILIRLYFYIINRSLWLDEAMLALNIVNRSFAGLLKPLEFSQGAPIGFLFAQKAVFLILGNKDYILRIIPLLGGLVSVPLMYLVSQKYSRRLPAYIALGLFVFSAPLIYYSSELKQYSIDVLATLMLLCVVPAVLEEGKTNHAFIIFGIAGSIAIWFSHPALFVFAGSYLTLGLFFILKKDVKKIYYLIGIGAVWGISLGLIYFINLRFLMSNENLLNYWKDSFAPFPPWRDINWYGFTMRAMLKDPAALPVTAITFGVLIIGIFSFAFKRWQFLMALLGPFLILVITSALGKYPIKGRLILFLTPILFILLAEGIDRVRMVILRINRPLSWIATIALVGYFFMGPMTKVINNIINPGMREDIRPVVVYISQKIQNTDLIYIYSGSEYAFEYYAPLYGMESDKYIVLEFHQDPEKYIDEISNIQVGQRVWFVFSHRWSWDTLNQKDYLLHYLDSNAIKMDEVIASGAAAYLYNLAKTP